MRNLVWFRRDLRVQDNAALSTAAEDLEGIVGVYLLTPQQWRQHDDAGCKVNFWIEGLRDLSSELQKLNIPLIVESVPSFADAPQKLIELARQHQCDSIFWNREYEVHERRRDQAVAEAASRAEVGVRQFHDRIIVPPNDIATKDGRFYSVFTPYRRVWETQALAKPTLYCAPKKQADLGIASSTIPETIDGFSCSNSDADRSEISKRWPASASEAKRRLLDFQNQIADYDQGRDVPSLEGTSQLSPYLAAGMISPRQCLAAAIEAAGGSVQQLSEGAKVWISELTWRDFYTHVMVGFPRVSMHRPFKVGTDNLNWRDDANDLLAWQTGQTGYPLVDAGMRQLNQTGWMHNRLRMVTAMFLTKNLLIDWRLGEKYFMQKLIDGDLSANNGGWQWSASTGTDAVPYFRIFNPFSQSKRFDPDGVFIKKMCPELEPVPAKSLHDPAKLTAAIEKYGCSYPDYVVDYKTGRERALAAFKSI